MLLFKCLNSVCNDSANPWTANCAVDKETLFPPVAVPERPATDDRTTMCPFPARSMHGKTVSNNWKQKCDAKICDYCNKLCIILKIFTQKWLRIVKSIVCLISGGSWSNALGLGILQQWKSIVTSPNSDLIIFTIRATYYILFTIKSMYNTYYIIYIYIL